MNKSQVYKSKLKTLPNELSTQSQEFLFKSQCEEDYTKKINIASPTFGTEIGSIEECYEKTIRDYPGKENRISLCLKEYKNHDNESEQTKNGIMDSLKKGKEMEKNKQLEKEVCTLRNQNAEKTEELKKMENELNKVVERNEYLEKMYTTIKKKLDMKYCESICKVYHHYPKNSSSEYENIDLYIETQALKQDYKKFQDLSEQLQKENEKQEEKIQELQADKRELEKMIVVYTEKSEKKKIDKEETIQIEREKMEEMKRKYENKFVMIEADRVEKDKQIKKMKEEYDKVKFLKEEIEKKRKEDLEIREELEANINETKKSFKELEAKLKSSEKRCEELQSNLIQSSNQESEIKNELRKSFELEITKLQFSESKALTEKEHITHQLENYKLINSKYNEEITQLRAENLELVNMSETLKIEKGKLEIVIMKYAANEDRIGLKNTELENRIIEIEKEKEELIAQFDKSSKEAERMHPEISNFKEDEESEKESSERIDSSHNKLTGIIMDLNKEVETLKRSKEALEMELDSEKERNEKISRELQDTCRKIEDLPYSDINKNQLKRENFPLNPTVLSEAVIATKAIPQLRMIKDIMTFILNSPIEPNPRSLHNLSQPSTHILESLICDIKKIAEEVADFFDHQNEQIGILNVKIGNKEEVISKLLRFTPEHKKSVILEYLNIMEGIEEFPVEQVYKVTRNLEEEASEWKSSINNLFSLLQAKEEELESLKSQFIRIKDNRDTRDYRDYRDIRDIRDPREGWMSLGAYEKDNKYVDKMDPRRRH